MKSWYIILLLLLALAFASCEKNTASNIPQISLASFTAVNGSDTVRISKDTAVLVFNLADGDADLGNPQPGPPYDIYVNDKRFDTGFQGYFFPTIDQSIENAKLGVTGVCTFLFTPVILDPRGDSIHLIRDTVHFEVYIVDRAGHHSNHIVTKNIILVK